MAGLEEAIGHPLDPLTAAEIEQATSIIRRDRAGMERLRFPLLMLAEPPKEEVYGFEPGDPDSPPGARHPAEPGRRERI